MLYKLQNGFHCISFHYLPATLNKNSLKNTRILYCLILTFSNFKLLRFFPASFVSFYFHVTSQCFVTFLHFEAFAFGNIV